MRVVEAACATRHELCPLVCTTCCTSVRGIPQHALNMQQVSKGAGEKDQMLPKVGLSMIHTRFEQCSTSHACIGLCACGQR